MIMSISNGPVSAVVGDHPGGYSPPSNQRHAQTLGVHTGKRMPGPVCDLIFYLV